VGEFHGFGAGGGVDGGFGDGGLSRIAKNPAERAVSKKYRRSQGFTIPAKAQHRTRIKPLIGITGS